MRKRDQTRCPKRCAIDCHANLKGGECVAPFIDFEDGAQDEIRPPIGTIKQYNSDVYEELQKRATISTYAFEKDFMDGAHELFIILRNKGLIKGI